MSVILQIPINAIDYILMNTIKTVSSIVPS